MEWGMRIALSNAALASVAAPLAWAAGRLARKPALTHALWVIVLLKLITPPLWSVPVQWPAEQNKSGAASAPTLQPNNLARPRASDSVGSALADASSAHQRSASAKADPTR